MNRKEFLVHWYKFSLYCEKTAFGSLVLVLGIFGVIGGLPESPMAVFRLGSLFLIFTGVVLMIGKLRSDRTEGNRTTGVAASETGGTVQPTVPSLITPPQNPTQAEEDRSEIYVNFIRILFAIVVGQGFVLLTRSTSEGGFREWFADPMKNGEGLFTLLLGYSLVITSFVGYSESTGRPRYPIRKPWRFIIDVSLVFLYYLLFALAADFQLELGSTPQSSDCISFGTWSGSLSTERTSPRVDLSEPERQ